jgi:hypothetical protein
LPGKVAQSNTCWQFILLSSHDIFFWPSEENWKVCNSIWYFILDKGWQEEGTTFSEDLPESCHSLLELKRSNIIKVRQRLTRMLLSVWNCNGPKQNWGRLTKIVPSVWNVYCNNGRRQDWGRLTKIMPSVWNYIVTWSQTGSRKTYQNGSPRLEPERSQHLPLDDEIREECHRRDLGDLSHIEAPLQTKSIGTWSAIDWAESR